MVRGVRRNSFLPCAAGPGVLSLPRTSGGGVRRIRAEGRSRVRALVVGCGLRGVCLEDSFLGAPPVLPGRSVLRAGSGPPQPLNGVRVSVSHKQPLFQNWNGPREPDC